MIAVGYETMDEEERASIHNTLDEMDEILGELEKKKSSPSNITQLEEIRDQRKRIKEFKALITQSRTG